MQEEDQTILFDIIVKNPIHCYYDKNESLTLDICKNLCPVQNKNDKQALLNTLQYTRFFGPGTLTIIVILIFLYYKFGNSKKYKK
jgi:hypothetical protein